jgi:hypothetical protein
MKVPFIFTFSLVLVMLSIGSYASSTSSQQSFSLDGNGVQLVFGEDFSTSEKEKLKQ